MKKYKKALVFGAGAFGTSIASVLANKFEKVYLKIRSQDIYNSLIENKNEIYLPGLSLPNNLIPVLDWKEIVENKDDVELMVSGLPTVGIKPFYKENFEYVNYFIEKNIPIVSLSKGIDPNSLELPDDLFFKIWPAHKSLFLFLSGPSFAKEIIEKQITMATLAGSSYQHLTTVCNMMNTNYFKLMMSYDIKGVLLGGALKNVIAIAGGFIEGMGGTNNTRAALLTRAITEMLRFGVVYNARSETFYGLSGMGDLILTTTGGLSRNKLFGIEIAKGRSPQDIMKDKRSVVEGYKTALAAERVATKFNLNCRIFKAVYQVLYENLDLSIALDSLMNVPSKFEND